MKQKSGVIINLASGRGNGKGAALAEALRDLPVELKVLNKFADLKAAVFQLAQAEVSDLFISSGDGTIQAVATLLQELHPFKTMPRLCILPHGTTNLTAIDLGFHSRNIDEQAAFTVLPFVHQSKWRHTLKITNPRDGVVRHGFTLGAGAAARATRLTQTDFNDKGRKGQFAAGLMLAGAIGKALFTKPDPSDPSRLDRALAMEASVDGANLCSGNQLMLIATTLEKQFFNTRPFWGGKHGAIRASAFAYPPPNLLRWLIPIMYGSESRKMPPGTASKSGQTLRLFCAEPYVMDGEFFDGPEDGPLLIEAGPALEFIIR